MERLYVATVVFQRATFMPMPLKRAQLTTFCLDNVDYNELKYYIKAKTSRDQAKAIAIPGQQDTALQKFENELYAQLCEQHARVDLFVKSKADELTRRLRFLDTKVAKLASRCSSTLDRDVLHRRQRQFVKLEKQIRECGDEVEGLPRFCAAQVKAFVKILKKYKKWTGSATLGQRFKDNVLGDLKSFTRRDFSPLLLQYQELDESCQRININAAPARRTELLRSPSPGPEESSRPTSVQFAEEVTEHRDERRGGNQYGPYWNEYDYGSENGDSPGEYYIYADAEGDSFPGMGRLLHFFSDPVDKVKAWLAGRRPEHQPLLAASDSTTVTGGSGGHGYGTARGTTGRGSYFTLPPGRATSPTSPGAAGLTTDTEVDSNDEASDAENGFRPLPRAGYAAHYAAFPSVDEQRVSRYREKLLFWGTLGCFATAFALLAVAATLIATGRHKLRVEVDAAATLAVVFSLLCACTALGLVVALGSSRGAQQQQQQQHRAGGHGVGLSLLNRVAVWVTFLVVCVLNGMVLVMVMGNTTL